MSSLVKLWAKSSWKPGAKEWNWIGPQEFIMSLPTGIWMHFNSNCPYIDAERCQVTQPVYVPLYTCVWICLLDPVQKSIFWWEGKESIFRPRHPGDTLSSKRKGWKVEDTQDEHYFFTGGPETGCGCVARFKSTKGSTTCSRMCSEKVPHYSFPKWIWILCIAWLRSPSFASLLL